MTNQKESYPVGSLLSEQERIAFKMIATGNDLHGQRAVALLAVDAGATQAEAARQASLTPRLLKRVASNTGLRVAWGKITTDSPS